MLSRNIKEKLHLAASLVSCKMRFRHFGYCGMYLEISATKGDVAVEQSVLLEIDCLCQVGQTLGCDMPVQILKGCSLH